MAVGRLYKLCIYRIIAIYDDLKSSIFTLPCHNLSQVLKALKVCYTFEKVNKICKYRGDCFYVNSI